MLQHVKSESARSRVLLTWRALRGHPLASILLVDEGPSTKLTTPRSLSLPAEHLNRAGMHGGLAKRQHGPEWKLFY